MSLVSRLSPAEALVLLSPQPGKVDGQYRRALKATLAELMFRGVVRATVRRAGSGRLARLTTYLERGPGYHHYYFKPHQLIFRDGLPPYALPLRKVASDLRSKPARQFMERVRGQLLEQGLLRREFKRGLFGPREVWNLTLPGDALCRELTALLAEGQQLAAYGPAVHPQHLRSYLARMGTNIFLLPSFTPELLREWGRKVKRSDGDSAGSGEGDDVYFFYSFSSFGESDSDLSSSFDAAFDVGSGSDSWGDGGSDGGSDGGDGGDGGGGGD